MAGALSEMIKTTMVHEFPSLAPRAKVHLVDHGKALLEMFADKGHAYSAGILEKDGVELRLGTGVTEIGPGHVKLSDGSTINDPLRHVGRRPEGGAGGRRRRASRRVAAAGSTSNPDFTVAGFPGRARRSATSRTSPTREGKTHPQLGLGRAPERLVRPPRRSSPSVEGKTTKPFSYLDKGTMAMIGRGAAVAQVKGVELHGKLAFAAWLGVHAALMTGGSNRVDAFKSWAVDFFGKERAPAGARSERRRRACSGKTTMRSQTAATAGGAG